MTSDEQIAMLREAAAFAHETIKAWKEGEAVDVEPCFQRLGKALALAATARPEQHPSGDSQEQGGGWRSMDSAPRAWQSIMLHEPDAERNNEVGEGYFDGAESDPGVGENCWKWADGTQAFPTRWRPLPAPPTRFEKESSHTRSRTEAEGEG